MKRAILSAIVGMLILGADLGCGDRGPKIVMPTATYPPAGSQGVAVEGTGKPRTRPAPAKEEPEQLPPAAPEKAPP
jgi:hypothetical protein